MKGGRIANSYYRQLKANGFSLLICSEDFGKKKKKKTFLKKKKRKG